ACVGKILIDSTNPRAELILFEVRAEQEIIKPRARASRVRFRKCSSNFRTNRIEPVGRNAIVRELVANETRVAGTFGLGAAEIRILPSGKRIVDANARLREVSLPLK